jgi:hypothetical protein
LSRTRPLRDGDLPGLADLWVRVFQRGATREGAERYLREVFVEHAPREEREEREEGITSLVHEDDAGSLVGFVGALPRRMVFRGRAIRAAVATQLMVEPGRRRGFAAFDLLRALFAGPQELTFSDGANERAAAVWQRSGGQVVRLYSIDWTRVLRPASHLRHRLARAGARWPARAAAPLCRAVDAMAERVARHVLDVDRGSALGVPFGPPVPRLAEEEVSAAAVRALVAEASPSLYPSYDAPSLDWLLQQAGHTRRHGALRARLCRDARGAQVGWYVYYAKPGGVSQVLQFGGKPGAIGGVLANLLADAHRAGSVAVTGQAEPRWLREITDAQATLSCDSLGVLVHARDPDIAAAVQRGDAFLSRLDGEWWLRFGADPLVA